jgi:hypothetical protein
MDYYVNYLWKMPDGMFTITQCRDTEINLLDNPEPTLREKYGITVDYLFITKDPIFPDMEGWTPECQEWDGEKIIISLSKAKEITKARIREERIPLLNALDITFMKNLEVGADNTAIVTEKNRLRDLPALVNSLTTLEELKGLKV